MTTPLMSVEEIARKHTAWLMNPMEIKYGESLTPEADAYINRADSMRAILEQLLTKERSEADRMRKALERILNEYMPLDSPGHAPRTEQWLRSIAKEALEGK